MELLYHVDEQDNVIGPVERNAAHQKKLLHRSGMVFLLNEKGEVLLQHRSPSKDTFPDCYDSSSAFHITFGETYDVGAARELLEETGVKADPKYVGKFVHYDGPEYEVVVVYFCRSDAPITIDPTESTGAKFFQRPAVEKIVKEERITPWLRDGWKLFAKYAKENALFPA